MNDSGKAVQAACAFHKIAPENVIVLHDEIELAPGKIRIKQGGGHAGHNGLKSIDAAIGQNYWRVRLGVGRPTHAEMDAADYVLSNFSSAEKKWLAPFLKSIAQHFPLLLAGQPSELMNRVTLDMKNTNNPSN
jgi:PTH1 family peptidyl-tRNA hydrolase